MSGSARPRLRSEISRGHSTEDLDEGTSARTRPLSYGEIMLRRKNKKKPEGFGEEGLEGEIIRREETDNNLDCRSRDVNSASMKHSRDHVHEVSSRNKEKKTSRSEDTHTKSRSKESHGVESKSKHRIEEDVRDITEAFKTDRREHLGGKRDEKSHNLDSRSKLKYEKDVKDSTEAFKTDRREHLGGKRDEKSHNLDSRSKLKYEKDVRDSTEAFKTDRREHGSGKFNEKSHNMDSRSKTKHEKNVKNSSEALKIDKQGRPRGKLDESHAIDHRSMHKHEKDVRNSTEALKNDRRDHVRSKLDEYSKDNGRYDYEKKHHKDSAVQDRHMERSGGASEREKKRKDRSGEDEKYRIRDPVKKLDSGSRWDSEISERKEKMEFSHPRHDESRSKRRRSRSQERTKDKGKRSSSSSPKAHKTVSSLEHDRGDTQGDKSRNHLEIERSKMSNNGSTSHHRRHGGFSSGLGGYSPRKRKTEAAVKTPSPIRSPERKSAGWHLASSGADRNLSSSVAPSSQLVSQTKSSNMVELSAGISVTSSMGKPLSAILSHSLSAFKEASLDSVQLTQATRPMRRLYIDNIPGAASEKEIMEFFNTFLLSSGPNYIRGTRPCISCMIHKEKGQALVEFLTPEDASAALSLDGRFFSGSILKIRRPKDFVEVTSGSLERAKPEAEAVINVVARDVVKDISVSDAVKDSPHKIFVGGIAEGLSSEMVMEIVSAFGPLKAYHFEINEDLNEPCAFLEYADESITSKACAGLNGMKLGGRTLTVAQAVPDTVCLESTESCPFYGIPEHVKSLLETPTEVLQLSNVLDQKALELLSETDLEEIVEDVRLECSRFGSIVSVNVVKASSILSTISETTEVTDDMKHVQLSDEIEFHGHHLNEELAEVAMDHDEGEGSEGRPPTIVTEYYVLGASKKGDNCDVAPVSTHPSVEVNNAEINAVEEMKEAGKSVVQDSDDNAAENIQETPVTNDSTIEDTLKTNNSREWSGVSSEMEANGSIGIEKSIDGETLGEDVQESDKINDKLQEVISVSKECATTNLGAPENGIKNGSDIGIQDVFEVGCVLVEFRRPEAACMAAHCLHGRVFDDRIVTVKYIPLDAYRARFKK